MDMGDKCALSSLSSSGKHRSFSDTTILFPDTTIGELRRFSSSCERSCSSNHGLRFS